MRSSTDLQIERRPEHADVLVEPARGDDWEEILSILRHYNLHNIPCPEMESLDLSCSLVARADGRVIGIAGYQLLSQTLAKTTLMALHPDYTGQGIGHILHRIRCITARKVGVKTFVTNTDQPVVAAWLKQHYAYREIGTLPKVCEYGDPNVDHWTTLEMDVEAYVNSLGILLHDDGAAQPDSAALPPLLFAVEVTWSGLPAIRRLTGHLSVARPHVLCIASPPNAETVLDGAFWQELRDAVPNTLLALRVEPGTEHANAIVDVGPDLIVQEATQDAAWSTVAPARGDRCSSHQACLVSVSSPAPGSSVLSGVAKAIELGRTSAPHFVLPRGEQRWAVAAAAIAGDGHIWIDATAMPDKDVESAIYRLQRLAQGINRRPATTSEALELLSPADDAGRAGDLQ